jgi:Uma2 family endonuclease
MPRTAVVASTTANVKLVHMETGERPRVRRFTADEAMRMVDAGILGDDEPVELLEGALVEMSPQGPRHAFATIRLAQRLRGVYAEDAHVREEKPLAASEHDLPEPDVAVVRGRESACADRHPSGADAILIVQLALTSQRIDRRKASIYASAGVEVYWLVDLAARRLEVRTTPVDGAYQVTQVLAEDDVVELPGSGARWTVRDLLP